MYKKAVGGAVLTRYLLLYALYSTEAWKESMLKVKNVKKGKKESNFKIL